MLLSQRSVKLVQPRNRLHLAWIDELLAHNTGVLQELIGQEVLRSCLMIHLWVEGITF